MCDRDDESQVFVPAKDYGVRKSLKYGSVTLIGNGWKRLEFTEDPG